MKNEQLLMDLTDEQCEKVVGGVGRLFGEGGPGGPAGTGEAGWFGGPTGTNGLLSAGQDFWPFPTVQHGNAEVAHPNKGTFPG